MLRSRCADFVFAFFFLLFVACNVLVELPVCRGEAVVADSPDGWLASSYDWGMRADRIWVEQPHWSRVAVCFHCVGFGPAYFLLALTFLFRWNWMRVPGIMVGTAKLYAGAYYMTTNLLDPQFPPAEPALFVTQSASYMLVPLLLVVRFAAYDRPFGGGGGAGKAKKN